MNKKYLYIPKFFKEYQYRLNGKKLSFEDIAKLLDDQKKLANPEERNLRNKIIRDLTQFYKWQFIRRNKFYRMEYQRAYTKYKENLSLFSGEAYLNWQLPEYYNPGMECPPVSFFEEANVDLKFHEFGVFSLRGLEEEKNRFKELENEEFSVDDDFLSKNKTIIDNMLLTKMTQQIQRDAGILTSNGDERFFLLAIDLKSNSNAENLGNLKSLISMKLENYRKNYKNQKSSKNNKISMRNSVLSFEEGLMALDYVNESKKYIGLVKFIETQMKSQNRNGSTLKRKVEAFRKYVDKCKVLPIKIKSFS